MSIDFLQIYTHLHFLPESIRLQYSNVLLQHADTISSPIRLENIIKRLKQDEPIEYILNSADFCGRSFYVDTRCLIPRIETQAIVEKIIKTISDHKSITFNIIDIGTGSGCIIVSIFLGLRALGATNVKEFIGIDISTNALEVAQINCERYDILSNEIQLINQPFQEFPLDRYKNLLVCSNLPYIPNNEKLQKSVINFEPHLALFGGEKGDELNNDLLTKITKLTNVYGYIMEGHNGHITSSL